jgi:fatty acid hydroxylase domain-containing protein 2
MKINENNKRLILFSAVPNFFLFHWAIAAVFIVVDVTQWPSFIIKYKTQPKKNDPLDLQKMKQAVKVVLFNQIVVNLLAMRLALLVLDYFQLWDRIDIKTVPSFPKLMLNLIACNLFHEIVLYCGHRLLHHRLIYKHIHKIHHEWTAPIAVTSQYCHPVEQVFCNLLPAIGFFFLGIDLASGFVTAMYITTEALFEHSGLKLPFVKSPDFHEFHHMKFNECFSGDGFLDELFGTNKNYKLKLKLASQVEN